MATDESITTPIELVSCACGCGGTLVALHPKRGYRRTHIKGHSTGRPLAERFWSKVSLDGPVHPTLGTACWLWTRSTNGNGYGTIKRDGASVLAHRVSWEIANGAIPDGLHVCHNCDNPPCVRPDHLFTGTDLDNRRDCVVKGRQGYHGSPGERHPLVKLTEAKVLEIRELSRLGIPQRRIAARFGVVQQSVSDIVRGKNWSHI